MAASKTARRGAGMGGVYQDATTGLWVGALTLPDGPGGKRRRKVVRAKTRKAVDDKLRALRKELDKAGDLATASPTVKQWMEHWLPNISAKRVRPKTQYEREGDVRRYILPTLGKYRLEKLTAEHVLAMHTYITDVLGLKSTTALRCHRVLSVAIRDAMRAGRVSRNVTTSDYMDAPAPAVFEARTYTREEAVALLAAAAKREDGARWILALLTGARAGEALGFEWEHLDLTPSDERLELRWQMQRLIYSHGCVPKPCGKQRAGSCPDRMFRVPADYEARQVKGGLHLVRLKAKTEGRLVPVVEPLLSVLKRHHERCGSPAAGLVFTTASGEPIDPTDDYQAWKELLADAGLPHIRRHDTRHTAATLLLALGVDAHVIQAIVGHSSEVMTRKYQHVNLEMARAALNQLGVHLAATPAQIGQ